MTDIELYWLAGLLEGEGTFLHGPPSNRNGAGIVLHILAKEYGLFLTGFYSMLKGSTYKHVID